MKMRWEIEQEHDGMLLRDYLQHVLAFSRRLIIEVKTNKGITVNGTPQTVRYCLSAGDILTIKLPKEEVGAYMKPEKIPLSIVYEDEDIIIINKEQGMATIPSFQHPTGTVANGLLAYYAENKIPYTVHIVTRLDRDTSGLLLIAKHRYSHTLLAVSQRAGEVGRRYKAVIQGHLKKKEGIINRPVGRKEGSIIERTVTSIGKRAITKYKVLKETSHFSLVDIKLETGRTHQIRVHFSSIGHPLAGDDLYGGSIEKMKRQALHCFELSFVHPSTNERMVFQSAVPEDIGRLMESDQSSKR